MPPASDCRADITNGTTCSSPHFASDSPIPAFEARPAMSSFESVPGSEQRSEVNAAALDQVPAFHESLPPFVAPIITQPGGGPTMGE